METVFEGSVRGSGATRLHLAPEGLALRKMSDGETTFAPYSDVAQAEVKTVGRRASVAIKMMDGGAWQVSGLHPLQARYAVEVISDQLRAANRRLLREYSEPLPRAELAQAAMQISGMHADGIIELVDFILAQAAQHGASDIHIEPFPQHVRVRYRIDGSLVDIVDIPAALRDRLFARLKVIGKLTIYRSDIPQEGRFPVVLSDRTVDVRLSMLPTIHGEKGVLRLFDPVRTLRELSSLGLTPEQQKEIEGLLQLPQGCLLLTGPSNSGKTTTLYAALQFLYGQRRDLSNICTVEDPVEYDLQVINQTQVNSAVGLSFANGLRTVLRQDPEVIMIGEIRDGETAEIAVRAGLTGHLILSSIHAPSAAGVFARLVELGSEPFLVASAVTAVLSQRLVRKICPSCVREVEPSPELLKLARIPTSGGSWRAGAGCEACYDTGYQGRTGIFQVLRVTEPMRQKVTGRASAPEIEALVEQSGQQGVLARAVQAAREGVTTLEEAVRVCGEA